jgi:hypothetical protein
MAPGVTDRGQMVVWCPLIPPDQIQKLLQNKDDLSKINEAYDDWRVSMRGKGIVSVKPGVFLDRIRMLMINVGISCERNRDLAELVQKILSGALRKHVLHILSKTASKTPQQQAVKKTLIAFFTDLKFTRDIYPIEEIREHLVLPGSSTSSSGVVSKILSVQKEDKSVKKKAVEDSLLQCTNVLKRLYIKLLSPDPWGGE